MGAYDREDQIKKVNALISAGKSISVDKNGNATYADGTPVPYNGNNFDDDPAKVAEYDATHALISAMQKMGEVNVEENTGSFEEFLRKYGNENARAYSESVRVANDSLYRSMMNYGKNAEMLAGNGLTSSGVSDYGNAAAYAARQGAVTEAGKARLQADTDDMAEYMGQIELANAEARREANALANTKVNTFLSAMQDTNLDEVGARMLATQAGIYDEDEINMFVDAAKKLGEQRRLEADTAQAEVDAENEKAQKETRFMNTLTAFESLIKSGKTAEEAKMYLEFIAPQHSQYDPDVIENIYNNHINVKGLKGAQNSENPLSNVPEETLEEAQTLYDNMIKNGATPAAAELAVGNKYGNDVASHLTREINSISDATVISGVNTMLKDNYSPFGENKYTVKAINNAINNKEISEAEGKAQIERIQQANLEWVNGVLDMTVDSHNIDRALAELEVSGEGLDAESKLKAAYNAINEKVKRLVDAGEMSEEKAAEYYVKYFDANIEENSDIEDIMTAFMTFKEKIGYLDQDGEELAYQKALEIVVANKSVGGLYAGTEFIAFDDNATSNSELSRIANGYCFSIKQGNVKNFNGKPKIGSFKVGETTITLYDKGMFSLNSSNDPVVDYIVGIKPDGIYKNGSRKKFDKNDRKAMGEIAEDILYAWMLKQCGK